MRASDKQIELRRRLLCWRLVLRRIHDVILCKYDEKIDTYGKLWIDILLSICSFESNINFYCSRECLSTIHMFVFQKLRITNWVPLLKVWTSNLTSQQIITADRKCGKIEFIELMEAPCCTRMILYIER